MKNIFVLFGSFLFAHTCAAQMPQFVFLDNVSVYPDSVVVHYSWEELDPVLTITTYVHNTALADTTAFSVVCSDEYFVTTGSGSCAVQSLPPGVYETYVYVEDGDQLVQGSDTIGFRIDIANSVEELDSYYPNGFGWVYGVDGRLQNIGPWQLLVQRKKKFLVVR
jgi:hypothetical protein